MDTFIVGKKRGIKQKIDNVTSGIRNRKFEAKPAYKYCNYCPFNNICSSVKN